MILATKRDKVVANNKGLLYKNSYGPWIKCSFELTNEKQCDSNIQPPNPSNFFFYLNCFSYQKNKIMQ